jgi:hypothetical protein
LKKLHVLQLFSGGERFCETNETDLQLFLSFIPFHTPVFPYPSALAGGRVYLHTFCNIANGYFSITGH